MNRRPPLTRQLVPENWKLHVLSRSLALKKTELGMTTGNSSGSGIAGSKVTCVELQSGCVMSLETETTLFLAGGERISLCFSCLTGGWPQYSQTMLLTLSNSSHSRSLHFTLGTLRLSIPIYPGYTKTMNTNLE